MIARVYAAISAVTSALAQTGIAKDRFNLEDGYAYRSIDDVVVRLAPLLAEHRLCLLPCVKERTVTDRLGPVGELLVSVAVRVAYTLVCAEDGSAHEIEVYGEALDASDKATAKALQSAYKYALLQAFAVPVSGSEDADARTLTFKQPALPIEPVQGWPQWCDDIAEVIAACETSEAIVRLQQAYRGEFAALQRERPELYAGIGEAMAKRREALAATSHGNRAPDGAMHSVVTPASDEQTETPAEPGESALSGNAGPCAPGRARKPRQRRTPLPHPHDHQEASDAAPALA